MIDIYNELIKKIDKGRVLLNESMKYKNKEYITIYKLSNFWSLVHNCYNSFSISLILKILLESYFLYVQASY